MKPAEFFTAQRLFAFDKKTPHHPGMEISIKTNPETVQSVFVCSQSDKPA